MNSFKSSPLLQPQFKPKFNRKSKRVSRPRLSKEQDVFIANPFRQGDQENYLPNDLKQQIQQLDYISQNQIQTITFTTASGARRSSLFNKHLQAMQNAAKKQEEMYHTFMGCGQGKKDCGSTEIMEEEGPITIE